MRTFIIGEAGLMNMQWNRMATQPLSGHLVLAIVLGTFCVAGPDLPAQHTMNRNSALVNNPQDQRTSTRPASVNYNYRNAAPSTNQQPLASAPRQDQPGPELFYYAVIGAIRTPTVFQSTEPAVPLKTLIDRAGGETPVSLGTVRIMEQARPKLLFDIRSNPNQMVKSGQVVFVTPRGGRPLQLVDSRTPAPDRLILISGLAPGPLLFNIGNQSQTLGDLLRRLGQDPAQLTYDQVIAVQPQAKSMDLDSLLVHNTVVHFQPEAVKKEGVQKAVQDGFQYQLPVKLSVLPLDPVAVPASREPEAPPRVPINTMPKIAPRSNPAPAAAGSPVTTDQTDKRTDPEIETTGSSFPFNRPLRFPSESDLKDETIDAAPRKNTNAKPPLMLPRSWQNSSDKEAEAVPEDPVRAIHRTSARLEEDARQIVTVGGEIENPALQKSPGTAVRGTVPRGTPPRLEGSEPEGNATATSPARSPQSWFALGAALGVAVLSVFVSRYLVHSDANTHASELSETEPALGSEDSENQEQRFLQRLIMNKVPVIEEEAILPPVDRLHGIAIGGRRLVIHAAQGAGPHFKVPAEDTRELELKLRRFMRSNRGSTSRKTEVVHSSGMREPATPETGPLERALRTVDRGGHP